jgi:hypothetical protein
MEKTVCGMTQGWHNNLIVLNRDARPSYFGRMNRPPLNGGRRVYSFSGLATTSFSPRGTPRRDVPSRKVEIYKFDRAHPGDTLISVQTIAVDAKNRSWILDTRLH